MIWVSVLPFCSHGSRQCAFMIVGARETCKVFMDRGLSSIKSSHRDKPPCQEFLGCASHDGQSGGMEGIDFQSNFLPFLDLTTFNHGGHLEDVDGRNPAGPEGNILIAPRAPNLTLVLGKAHTHTHTPRNLQDSCTSLMYHCPTLNQGCGARVP